jgi:hypothetical protein
MKCLLISFAFLPLVFIGVAGCASRLHLYRTVGEAKSVAFREQTDLHPEEPPPRPLSSIDAEMNLQNYQMAFTKRTGAPAGGLVGPSASNSIGGGIGAELSAPPSQGGNIQLQAK